MSDAPRDDPALVDALIRSYSILSLLHHRGLIDSDLNRADVAAALKKLEPFAKAAERIVIEQRAAQPQEDTWLR